VANIERIRIALGGAAVIGPSVMTLYASEGNGVAVSAAAADWLTNIKNLFPNTLNFQMPGGGDVLSAEDGALHGAWAGGTSVNIIGNASDNTFSHGVGTRVVWNTGAVAAGRRVRGSTFLVPVSGGLFDTTGDISSVNRTDMQTKGTAFVTATSGKMVVWSRPTPARPGGTATVVSCLFNGKVSWLQSRRT